MTNKVRVIQLSLMIFLTIILIISITFAWFMIIKKTDPIIVNTGSLHTSAKLYYKNDNEVYEEIVAGGIKFTNVVPGETYDYKIVVNNLGTIAGSLDINLYEVLTTHPDLMTGFTINYLNPLTNENISMIISNDNLNIFSNYVLDSNNSFDFYFSVVVTDVVSSIYCNESLTITSFVIRLDQLRN